MEPHLKSQVAVGTEATSFTHHGSALMQYHADVATRRACSPPIPSKWLVMQKELLIACGRPRRSVMTWQRPVALGTIPDTKGAQ
jgi:hypothetical protein